MRYSSPIGSSAVARMNRLASAGVQRLASGGLLGFEVDSAARVEGELALLHGGAERRAQVGQHPVLGRGRTGHSGQHSLHVTGVDPLDGQVWPTPAPVYDYAPRTSAL